MGQYKDTSIRVLVEGINQSYFLPDIQREYVWLGKIGDRKIENLFDSILRGYPIGSFLFWKLKKSDVETSRTAAPNDDKLNFDIYEFIEDFDVENIHNRIKDIARVDSNDLKLVLDGQQRLTSLFIGLRGSRTIKKPRTRNTYEKQYLYLNLKYSPTDDTAEDSYQFEFMSEQCVPARNEDNYWFKVRDIIDIDIFDYKDENGLGNEELRILHKLQDAICNKHLISYYEECEKNLDKVLKIFIRVNSGGTKLSYSDLLMSIMTRSFTDDIRTEINNRVDDYNVQGFGCFGRDQILKTALMLIGAKHTFSLKNFNKENITAIDKDWCGGIKEGSVVLSGLNLDVAAAGTKDAIDAAIAQFKAGTLHVFDVSKDNFILLNGQKITEYLADVDGDFVGETNVIHDGYFDESGDGFRSAPYFDIIIDGVTNINVNYGD